MGLFGTNGVRGIANVELTTEMAMDLAKSFGTFRPGTIAVGRDTRESGEMLKSAVVSGLLSTGCRVVDLGIAPIPSVQSYVRKNGLDGGIMVTASHNPPEYNGIKGIARDGTEYAREDEAVVERIYASREFARAPWSLTGSLCSADPKPPYIEGILAAVDAAAIRGKKFTVVADPGSGAASLTTPFLLRKLGCKVVTLNAQVDGTFPGRNPEPTGGEIDGLKAAVTAAGADLGVAHDCDADRAVFVDERGRFVNEDVLLAIMAGHILKANPGATMVTPVSSSSLVQDVADAYGARVVWTQVGSIHVARTMIATGAVFGGEGNGGLIFPRFQYCRDGGMSAASMLEMLAHTGRRLSDIVDGMPAYHSVKEKIRCRDKEAVIRTIEASTRGERVDATDGLKIYRPEGWVLIRMSGTEPIVRVFTESRTEEGARKLADYGVGLVNGANAGPGR